MIGLRSEKTKQKMANEINLCLCPCVVASGQTRSFQGMLWCILCHREGWICLGEEQSTKNRRAPTQGCGVCLVLCPFFVCVRSDQVLPRDFVVRKRSRTYAARHREPSNRIPFPAKSQTRPASHNTDYQIQDFVLQHNVGVFDSHDRCPKQFNSKFEFRQKMDLIHFKENCDHSFYSIVR